MDGETINKIFEDNKNLIHAVIQNSKYMTFLNNNPSYDYEDLYQEGCIALIKAIETFDESFGYSLSTYATICIQNSANEILRKHSNKKRGGSVVSLDNESPEKKAIMEYMSAREDQYDMFYEELKNHLLTEARKEGGRLLSAAKAIIKSAEEGTSIAKACEECSISKKVVYKAMPKIRKIANNV